VERLILETADQLLARTEVARAGVLDLSAVQAVDPYGMLLLVLIDRHHRQRGTLLPIRWPQHRTPRQALQSMGLPELLGREMGGEATARDASHLVADIAAEHEINGIVTAFDRRLLARYPLSSTARRRLTNVLFELFQNIPHHSNATGTIDDPMGMAAMQDDGEWIHLAVVDKGIGLAGSLGLRSGYGGISAGSALNRIIFLGMSRHLDPGRGGELQRIAELVRSWDGVLAIRSDDAVLYMDAERGDVYESPPFPGVQIGLRLPRRVLGIEEAPA
jgi:hypothetical protein